MGNTKTREKTEALKELPLEEMRVHRSWIKLISFCQESFQYGRLAFELVNAVPVKLNEKVTKTKKRFDIGARLADLDFTDGGDDEPDVIVMKVAKSWVCLIQFCNDSIPFGQICFEVVNAEPRQLLEGYCHLKVRFDKPETIPSVYYSFENIEEKED